MKLKIWKDQMPDGIWRITGNLPGLYLMGPDLSKLEEDLPRAVIALCHLNYKLDETARQIAADFVAEASRLALPTRVERL